MAIAYVALLHKPSAHLKNVVGVNLAIMPSLILVSLSALFLILSFPSFEFSWLAWAGFIPLFFALENKTKKQVFWLSYLWGVIFWAGLIYWLVNVTFLGYVFLVLYLALYFGLFGILSTYYLLLATNRKLSRILYHVSLPCIWVFLEYLRSHLFTGFGWALLGYTQYKIIPLIQISDITGAYGVSFIIILVNLVIFRTIKAISLRKLRIIPNEASQRIFSSGSRSNSKEVTTFGTSYELPATIFLIITCLFYGYHKLRQQSAVSHQPPIRTSLIQGNILPYQKWDSGLEELIIKKYILLSEIAAKEAPDLIIWPETSFVGFWEEEISLRRNVTELAKRLETELLIGAPTLENDLGYNCAILISDKGEELQRYRKVHPVPFGEYIPFSKILGFLENKFAIGNYDKGRALTVFQFPVSSFQSPTSNFQTSKFSVLICFEDIFSDLTRKFVISGAQFLVNITEDGWYGKTGASYQHMQAAVFRAAENKRFLVRVANTGYSCVINNFGKIISDLKDKDGNKLFITGVHAERIIPATCKTFYSQWGDIFAFVCIVISCVGFYVDKRKNPKL